MTRAELIAKLEAATEGSRELDAEVALALGSKIEWSQDDVGQSFPVEIWGDQRKGEKGPCPCFTTSIDAARTMVSVGMVWNINQAMHTGDPWFFCGVKKWLTDLPHLVSEADSHHPSASLALCIAALKAML